jgi:hypothetical protein
MMRARWIQLAGACRLAASLRSRRFSAGVAADRAYSGGVAMRSPRVRRHKQHRGGNQIIPDLANVALTGDLEAWEPYRRIEDAERYIARLNEILGHLRANGIAVLDDFELTDADRTTLYPSGTTVEVILDDAYARLRRFVALLLPLVPSAAAVGPRADERLTRLHRRIQEASAQLYLDGHQGSAILEAFKATDRELPVEDDAH